VKSRCQLDAVELALVELEPLAPVLDEDPLDALVLAGVSVDAASGFPLEDESVLVEPSPLPVDGFGEE
jgi:hypothetical protein